MRARQRNPRRVRFKIDRANEIAAEHGHISQLDRAAFFGVTNQNWSKVELGNVWPGERFIATVLASHPGDPRFTFEELFEVI